MRQKIALLVVPLLAFFIWVFYRCNARFRWVDTSALYVTVEEGLDRHKVTVWHNRKEIYKGSWTGWFQPVVGDNPFRVRYQNLSYCFHYQLQAEKSPHDYRLHFGRKGKDIYVEIRIEGESPVMEIVTLRSSIPCLVCCR